MGGHIIKHWPTGAQPTFMGALRPRRGAVGFRLYVAPFVG